MRHMSLKAVLVGSGVSSFREVGWTNLEGEGVGVTLEEHHDVYSGIS